MGLKTKLIFALDTPDKRTFTRWVDATKDSVDYYKIGLIPYTHLGPEAIRILKRRKKRVFLDLKFYDIPTTMIRAAVAGMRLGVDMIDFHLSAEYQALQITMQGIKRQARLDKLSVPLLLGVSVLTSVAAKKDTGATVAALAKKANDTGFGGIVLSGKEAARIRKKVGSALKLVCPGIRFAQAGDDQKRIVTPADIKGVADFIVVGRPIYTARRPREVITRIITELR